MFTSRIITANILFLVVLCVPAFSQTSFDVPFTYQIGGSVPAAAQYNIFSATPVAVTLQTDGATWVSASLSCQTAPAVLTISVKPTGLSAGKYTSTVEVDSSSGSLIFSVTLTVTGVSTSGLSLDPSTLTFTAVAGGGTPASQTLKVSAQTSKSATIQVSKQSCTTANWLSISPTGSFTAGTTLTAFTVSVDQTGIPAGSTCAGTISVTTGSGTETASVTLSVTAPVPVQEGLTFSATGFTFTAAPGGGRPAAQMLSISASTNTNATVQASEQTCNTTNWLNLSPTGNFTEGPTPTTFTISVDPSGMTSGNTCKGIVQVISPFGTQTMPVTMNVLAVPSAPLVVSPAALTFDVVSGARAVASQIITLTAAFSTNATVQVTKQSCGTANWLSISPTGSFIAGLDATTITVSVDPSGMAVGSTCAGTVLISALGTWSVPVTLKVSAPAPVDSLTVTPSSFLFTAPAGGTPPASQTLSVSAAATTSATIQTSEQSCTNSTWLSVSPSGSFSTGSSGTTFAVSVDQSGLLVGTLCRGAVTITWAAGTQTMNVTMFVTTPAGGNVVVSASPATLSFRYSVGDPNPAQQVIAVSGGGSAATFAMATSASGWMKVSAACTTAAPCTAPNNGTFNLLVTVDPTGLDAGTYYGTVVVFGTGQTTGTTTVNVSFTVVAPVPAITLITNAASFLAGPIAPGEMISIFGSPSAPIGPTTAARLDESTCPSPCTSVPTEMRGVEVVFQPGGISAPLMHVNSTQINCMVPYEVLGSSSGRVEVRYLGQRSGPVPVQYVPAQPGIFTALGTGTGLASVQQYDADGNHRGQNSSGNPAAPGWTLVFYMTGEGMVPAPATTGKVTSGGPVLPLLGPPTVLIDNVSARVSYYSEAEGLVSGLMQVNAIVPSGTHLGQVALSVSMNGTSTQPGVFIFVKQSAGPAAQSVR